MNSKRVLSGLAMTLGLGFFSTGLAAQKPAEKPALKQLMPLIRMDLLRKKTGHTTPARRDLFSPQNVPGGAILPVEMPKVKTTIPSREVPSEESQATALVLHYIGYSFNKTKQKFVALVFFEEQVTAVQEGDILPPGWKVLKITAKELEIEGPDKKSQTFSREGEQR